MNFTLGLVIGFVIGILVMHLVNDWLDSQIFKDDEEWLGRLCPPCDGKCRQGRYCPNGTNTTYK